MKYIIRESQYKLLTGEITTLLSEGRKEELVDKYTNKFVEYPSALSSVLDNEFIIKTNYKYADFLLKELHPNSSEEEILDAIEVAYNFNRFQKNFDKKDITQYKSLEELENVVKLYLASREPKSEFEKIYGDNNDRFIVVIPKNEKACQDYGANTKWCVTIKDSTYFKNYTAGNQHLYFIIDRNNTTDEEFSKVAVHISNYGQFDYWDSKDKRLSEKEIRLLNYAIPDVIKAIKDDYKNKSLERKGSFLDGVFSEDLFSSNELKYEIPGSDKFLLLKLFGFESETPEHAKAYLDVFLYDELYNNFLIDKYEIYITYKLLSEKTLGIDAELTAADDYIDNFIDLELNGDEIMYYPIPFEYDDEKTTAKKIREIILREIHARLADNGVDNDFIGEKLKEMGLE